VCDGAKWVCRTDLVLFVLEPYSEFSVFEKVVGLGDGGDTVWEFCGWHKASTELFGGVIATSFSDSGFPRRSRRSL
jgi:hypothetical protein